MRLCERSVKIGKNLHPLNLKLAKKYEQWNSMKYESSHFKIAWQRGGGGGSEHFRIILFVPSYNGYGNLFSIEDIYFYLYLNQRFFQTFRHSL